MLSRPVEVVNRRRPATVLPWAWRMICAQARGPTSVRTCDRGSIRGLLFPGRDGTGRSGTEFGLILFEGLKMVLKTEFAPEERSGS